jgi:hypothetical protein
VVSSSNDWMKFCITSEAKAASLDLCTNVDPQPSGVYTRSHRRTAINQQVIDSKCNVEGWERLSTCHQTAKNLRPAWPNVNPQVETPGDAHVRSS